MLSAALSLMGENSKVILCGATATYNSWKDKQGIVNTDKIISKRIQVRGILYFNEDRNSMMEAFAEMVGMEVEGVETLLQGITSLPSAYRDVIEGKHLGKTIIQL